VVRGPEFVGIHLTRAAKAHGLDIEGVLPEDVMIPAGKSGR
jgi:hypothetical protein